MKSSLEIAQEAELVPIEMIAESCGLQPEEIEPYGRYKAKIGLGVIDRLADRPDGKLICVTGMTPTKAGEGKTTTLVGLTQGLGHIGKSPIAWMSPVKWRLRSSIGTTCVMPPPAAPPLMPNTGPSDGSRRHAIGDLPMWPSPWVSPTSVVVLPSPAFVGLIPATHTIFASGASFLRSTIERLTFAL